MVIKQINRMVSKITKVSDSQIYAHFFGSGCSQQQHIWNTKVIYTVLSLWSHVALKCHNQISLNLPLGSLSNNLLAFVGFFLWKEFVILSREQTWHGLYCLEHHQLYCTVRLGLRGTSILSDTCGMGKLSIGLYFPLQFKAQDKIPSTC